MAVLDASPSRERLGRVVELLRGVEGDANLRWTPPRRGRRPVVRPRAVPRATGTSRIWDEPEPPPVSAP